MCRADSPHPTLTQEEAYKEEEEEKLSEEDEEDAAPLDRLAPRRVQDSDDEVPSTCDQRNLSKPSSCCSLACPPRVSLHATGRGCCGSF